MIRAEDSKSGQRCMTRRRCSDHRLQAHAVGGLSPQKELFRLVNTSTTCWLNRQAHWTPRNDCQGYDLVEPHHHHFRMRCQKRLARPWVHLRIHIQRWLSCRRKCPSNRSTGERLSWTEGVWRRRCGSIRLPLRNWSWRIQQDELKTLVVREWDHRFRPIRVENLSNVVNFPIEPTGLRGMQ